MKQKLTGLKGERDYSVTIVGELNAPPSIMDKTTRHKINMETAD